MVYILSDLAGLLRDQGRYEEAELLHRRALNIVDTLNDLAGLHRDQGRYGEAEPLYRRALALRVQALDPESLNTATSLNNLGALLLAKSRFKKVEVEQSLLKEAEPLLKQALEIREAKLGQDHPDTAVSLNHLGVLLRVQGLPEEAEGLHRRALAIREAAALAIREAAPMRPNHPDVAQSLNNLAESLRAQRRFEEAEPLYCRRGRSARRRWAPSTARRPTSSTTWGRCAGTRAGSRRRSSCTARRWQFSGKNLAQSTSIPSAAERTSPSSCLSRTEGRRGRPGRNGGDGRGRDESTHCVRY